MRVLPALLLLSVVGCVDDSSPSDGDLPGYAFPSRLDGADSVAYDGQIARHVLIESMKVHLGELTERLDTGLFPEPGDVEAELDFYFSFDDAIGADLPHGLAFDPAPLQTTFGDVSSGKNLVDKIAGNDAVTDHVDFTKDLVGWPGASSPEALVRAWMSEIDAAAVGWSEPPLGPDGAPVPAVYVTSDGRDLQQLLEKFLRVSIAFAQGADDYLDDDVEGKGLLADHDALVEGEAYTSLEHQWDEGFGYFGAARTYVDWSDETIADPGYDDVDEDGAVDLLREVAWGHSGNAAKRDLGSVSGTDLTQRAWDALYAGRALLAETDGALTGEQLDTLRGHRDEALAAWEATIAATAIHYINDTLKDMNAIGTEAYDFGAHAKHWSELKGFALGFQFNPHSAVSPADFQQLHDRIGTAPVLGDAPSAERDAYRADLLAARDLLQASFGFDEVDMGDEEGVDGW